MSKGKKERRMKYHHLLKKVYLCINFSFFLSILYFSNLDNLLSFLAFLSISSLISLFLYIIIFFFCFIESEIKKDREEGGKWREKEEERSKIHIFYSILLVLEWQDVKLSLHKMNWTINFKIKIMIGLKTKNQNFNLKSNMKTK